MKTPYFLINEAQIEKNCKILDRVRRETGCKILLAQKAYSCYDTYPLIAKYLDGTTASGLFEARLGKEKFHFDKNTKREVHVFTPAFKNDEITEIVKTADHIVFNSGAQLFKHYNICKKNGLQIGIRINPEFRTQEREIYDPCAPFSRFGVMIEDFTEDILSRIDGLHFHTLCEQGLAPLADTLAVVEKEFGKYFPKIKWINFGGGHHITREDYDVNGLIKLINNFKKKYNIQVYLEPGEAVVLNSGTLHSSVLDIVRNQRDIAILDVSAATHMPDILETQHHYMPPITGAEQYESEHFLDGTARRGSYVERSGCLYRLAGNTCLAGDVIGDYVFNKKLNIGDTIVFCDMALYSIVKTNMFNGVNLPSIYIRRISGKIELAREFGYRDYISRLGK